LFSGDITQKGYEKKRAKLLTPLLKEHQEKKEEEAEPEAAAAVQQVRRDAEKVPQESAPDTVQAFAEVKDAAPPRESASSAPTPLATTVDSVPSTSAASTLNNGGCVEGATAAAPASTAARPPSSKMRPPSSKKPRSRHRQKRYTHSEKRYHSEVRQEAVQQALAAMHGKAKAVPLPSKRSSVMRTSKDDDEEETGRKEAKPDTNV
jgi:hypothetical protein